MNSATARVENTVSGIPWQPSSAASARHDCGSPPGESSSAHSSDSVQVTALAAGATPADCAIWSRCLANISR
jgi:hypothetical protein